MPGTQGQFFQERAVPHLTDIVPGNSFRLIPNKGDSCTRTCGDKQLVASFKRMLVLMASVFTVLQLGLIRMRTLQY